MSQIHHDRPANRLAGETSPYLLQHAHNPVDWYPWGPEAIDRARAEDRPIFLSVGYSACHWCHVMERESFEEPAIAAVMNERFVCVKVDREERPDLDQIYMAAVQAMTGQGGWPMSVFLTPDLVPFYGGTYYPPADARGMPGFPRVLLSVHQAWLDRREEIVAHSEQMLDQLKALGEIPASSAAAEPGLSILDNAARALAKAFEPRHGGFGSAPKFPHPMDLKVLARHVARTGDAHSRHMLTHTLDSMARGGIYDHLGGGFARYSTDDEWLVPHFEKMLYDNALLASVYLEAFQLTADPEYARVARETLDYVLGRMTDPQGGLYATEDADSEGVEGKYYVWTADQVREVLGSNRAEVFNYVYGVTERGNWEHSNILHLPRTLAQSATVLGGDADALRRDLDVDRAKLLAARDLRVPPGKDTKVLASWNGLMLAPLAEAGAILGDPRYVEAARRAAAFVLDAMRAPDGRLLHSSKDGRARFNAYLDDYADVIDGLARLFEATGEPRWVEAALDLSRVMIAEFHDPAAGGFFYTGAGHEALIARTKDAYDNATPSGNAMAATALARLGALTGRADLTESAWSTLRAMRTVLDRAPAAAGQALVALDFLLAPAREVAVVSGDDLPEFSAALEAIAAKFLPNKVVAPSSPSGLAPADLIPLLADRPARDGRVTAYICEDFTCRAPVVGVEEIRTAIRSL